MDGTACGSRAGFVEVKTDSEVGDRRLRMSGELLGDRNTGRRVEPGPRA